MIKILFLAANPSDTTRLRLDEEIRAIDEKLRQTEYRDKFDIKQHWAVRITDLQSYLLRHRPNIVHFSGHGSYSNEIILEDNYGDNQPVSTTALSQLFSTLKDNIRCVVLNACYSETQAKEIAEHIDCVIGMSEAISDSAAISFSASFYQALGYGKDIKTAFDLGLGQIELEGLNEKDIPQLLCPNTNPREIVFVTKISSENDEQDANSTSAEPKMKKDFLLKKKRRIRIAYISILITILGIIIANTPSWYKTFFTDTSEHGNSNIYRLRVTVIGSQGTPVEDAEVWSSIGGEPKKVVGGWQFDIPAASKPKDGNLTVVASKKSAFLTGKKDLQLNKDYNPAITIHLTQYTSATVRGVIVDAASGQAVSGALVSVIGYGDEAIRTGEDGNFVLPAYAAEGQSVHLRVEKEGYHPVTQWHPAGKVAVEIYLERR